MRRRAIEPGLLRGDRHRMMAGGRIVRADLRADAVLQRRDDLAARGVVLGVGAEDEQHVERQPHRIALNLDVALLQDVEQADLNLAGQVGQLVDREDAAVGARQQPVVHRQLVGELQPAARRLDRIEIADHVGDRDVGRRELLDIARLARAARRSADASPSGATRARHAAHSGANGSSWISQPGITGIASSSRSVSARRIRLFACPRSPSRMKLWRDRTALTICGTTVSS